MKVKCKKNLVRDGYIQFIKGKEYNVWECQRTHRNAVVPEDNSGHWDLNSLKEFFD